MQEQSSSRSPRLASIQRYYDRRAGFYDGEANWNYRDRALLHHHVRILDPRPTDKVLDIATGTGAVGEVLKEHVSTVVGVDISEGMLKIAQTRLDIVVMAMAQQLPFPTSTFDLAVCRQGIHYMDPAVVLAEMRRVTKRAVLLGQITCIDIEDSIWWWRVFRRLTPDRKHIFTGRLLAELMESAGFEAVKTHYYTERNSLNGWLRSIILGAEEIEEVRKLFLLAPQIIKDKYEFEFTADGDVLYTHLWALVLGRL